MTIWFGTPDVKTDGPSITNTVIELLGFEFTKLGDDWLELTMRVDERHLQPIGLLHGGISITLAETACSMAAALTVDSTTYAAVGQEINANHIRPGLPGDTITARATQVSRGSRTQVWDIRLTNQDDKLVCISRCTMAIIEKPGPTS